MKRLLFLAIMLIGLFMQANATHLMGGQITVSQDTTGAYTVYLTVYRDTLGIPISPTQNITIADNNSSWSNTMTLSITSSSVVNGTNLFYGAESYVYSSAITFPSPSNYKIYWTDCCRNGAILNMANPLSESFYLMTNITVFPNGVVNNSPVYLTDPVFVAPFMSQFQLNPLPFDADGDSLSWKIDFPLNDFNIPVGGYSTPPSDPSFPFEIDSLTGEIRWMPNTLGNFVFSVLCEEYRNGVKIGEVRRDVQMIVVNIGNNMPSFSPVGGVQVVNGRKQATISTTAPTQLIISAKNRDNSSMELSAFGEPMLPNNGATFSSNGSNGNINGTFNWQPTAAQIRKKPYTMVFRAYNSSGYSRVSNDYTLVLNVSNATSNTTITKESQKLAVLGNPITANDMLVLMYETDLNQQEVLQIYSSQGQLIQRIALNNLASGKNQLLIDQNLSAGIYFAQIVGKHRSNIVKIIVQ